MAAELVDIPRQDYADKAVRLLANNTQSFEDIRIAVAGLERINADYHRHQLAARRLAEQYFATDRVLPALLETALS